MSINIKEKNDYSSMFSSLGSGASGAAGSNFLSDYASIKNGSYGKLMKAYYGSGKSSSTTSGKTSSSKNILEKLEQEKRNPKVSKDTQEANNKLTAAIPNLKTSLSALQSNKTYTTTEDGKSAADKVVSAVKAYVSDYNDVVTAAKGSTLSNKTAYVANMMSSTATNADKLSEIGINVNDDGTLSVNEAKLKAADLSKVQELFSPDNITSYGSTVASRVKFAGSTSGTTAASSSNSTETSSTAASSAASLKADARALASDELYEKITDKDDKETAKYDIDKIFATAKSFVNNYNNMFDKTESSTNSGVLANLSNIREKTAHNEDALKQFGISVDSKGRMKIDEDTFKKADMSEVKEFFKDYGSSIATSASLVDYYSNTQASAANGYTTSGTYNVQGSSRYTGTV